MRKLSFYQNILLFFVLLFSSITFAENISDPCATGLLALINRPSLTGSACVVPPDKFLIEGGYQYLNLDAGAIGYIIPQAELHVGLPGHNELLIIAPSYFHQTISPRAGWSAPSASFKHELGYNSKWVSSVEEILTLPQAVNPTVVKLLAVR